MLPRPVRIVAPRAGPRLEFRARAEAGRPGHTIAGLAGIGGRAEVHIEMALWVDHERMHRMIAAERKSGNDDLRRPGRDGHFARQSITHDAVVHLRIEPILVKCDPGTAVAALRIGIAEADVHVSAAVPVDVLQRHQKAAGRWRVVAVIAAAPGIHEDNALGGNDEMPGVTRRCRQRRSRRNRAAR